MLSYLSDQQHLLVQLACIQLVGQSLTSHLLASYSFLTSHVSCCAA